MSTISRLNCWKKGAFRRLLLEQLESRRVLASTPILSEILASNSDGLRDEDGESSDWIELYNPTSAAFDLSGWHLTDQSSDLNQWTFPSVVIEPNDFLTIFASGKDRSVAGNELHTNFRLSAAGDFLALVNPNGIVVDSFTPNYPPQATNVSYGRHFDTQTFLELGSPAQTLVPNNNLLGNSWQLASFNAASWQTTPVGIGYGVVEPGFNVDYYQANVSLNDLTTALNVISTPSLQAYTTHERSPVVNYLGSGSGANYANDNAFPTQSVGDDINDFLVRATSTVTIPTSGQWTFGVNSDDGFRLTLTRNGVSYVSEFAGLRGPADTITTFNLPAAGAYEVTLVMFERGGGASVELFAAPGAHSVFNPTIFDLVGDTANGGLDASISVPSGPDSPLQSDISASMHGVNATAYLRVPFTITDPANIDSLLLRMRYNDGFVAYLNGVEIARRNAPSSLSYNSAALSERTVADALLTEQINVSNFRSNLQSGTNVLAIHGLNSSSNDGSFLILPELIGGQLFENDLRYFQTVTPAAPNAEPSLGITSRPTFNISAGFYDATQSIVLTTSTPGATIRYTVDGSTPSDTNGALYASPIIVNQTTVIRAVAYLPDYVTLPSVTSSYLFLDDIIQQSANGNAPPSWPTVWNTNVVDYGMDPDVLAIEGTQAVKNALLAIPTLNITTDLANLFDPSFGIYSNAQQEGSNWERPASLELIDPNGTASFQANAGLRIRGGYSRSDDNPKHSFRLFFRGEYGDSNAEYPLAGIDAAGSFKKIDLRTAQNYSWSFGGDPSNNFIVDRFNRLSQQAMGMPSTSSQWYHLYLNGQYWGLYETQERSEADFAATYFGGISSNYDVIKAEAGPYTVFATDGNLDAWYQLWTIASANNAGGLPTLSENDVYFAAQGKNLDGTDNSALPVLIDVDNLAVYMIGILYGGNLDAPISNFLSNTRVNNFYAIRDRTGREGFKFFLHDSEHTLRDVNENRNGPWPAGSEFQYFNPQWLHQRLMTNAEYRTRFADLVQKFFFYDGVLSPTANQARFQTEAARIDQAIIAESMRWGDSKRPTSPLLRSDWINAVNNVLNNYFPARGTVLLNQFRNTTWNGSQIARLFPTIDAPAFLVDGLNMHGGTITPTSTLRFGSSAGTVYYTLDGSDPRLVGGGVSPTALSYVVSSQSETLISASSNWKYSDQGTNLGTAWRTNSYNDASWATGQAELGYGDGDETTVVSYGPNANNKYVTTYFRKAFSVSNVAELTSLTLQLKRDDGAVVYLNGVEVARSNMPTGTINSTTLATSAVGGSDEATFYSFSISPSFLVNGNNVLAIEIHQSNATSSDVSFDASLAAIRQQDTPIALGIDPSFIRARTLSTGGEWSALEEAAFSVELAPATSANLIVTELHYNPQPYTGENANVAPFNDAQNFEFIELRNISSETILLDGVSFAGITYTFPSSASGPVTWLLPGEIIVIAKNQIAFAQRYMQPGSPYESIKLAPGDYGTSNLSNGGETITVYSSNAQEIIQSFTFDDNGVTGWPITPDGSGPSLTPIYMNPSQYNLATNWRASFALDGTPGFEENDAPTGFSIDSIEVDENSTHTWIGDLSAFDPDLFDSHVFSIVPGLDASYFEIVGNELQVGSIAFNYETKAGATVRIRATDAAGAFVESNLSITIRNLNDAPLADAGGPYQVFEGQQLTLQGSGSDEDQSQTLSYEWDFDYDGITFDVDSVQQSPSFSRPDQLTVTVALRVTDNGTLPLSSISTALVTVQNFAPALGIDNAHVQGNINSSITNSGTWADTASDTVTLSASLGQVTKNANGTWVWSISPNNVYSMEPVTITATDEDGGETIASFTMSSFSSISARHVYYRESVFASQGVNQALSTSKTLLASTSIAQTTTFANVTNFSRGINGVVIDVAGLTAANLTSADFIFRVAPAGASGNVIPATWPSAPTPSGIFTTPANGTTAGRVRIEWTSNTIRNTWLQVIVLPTANTGLQTASTFYLGNAIGEVNGVAPYRISAADLSPILNNISNALVSVNDIRDVDKNRRISASDVSVLQQRISNDIVLRNIIVPAAGSADEGSSIQLMSTLRIAAIDPTALPKSQTLASATNTIYTNSYTQPLVAANTNLASSTQTEAKNSAAVSDLVLSNLDYVTNNASKPQRGLQNVVTNTIRRPVAYNS